MGSQLELIEAEERSQEKAKGSQLEQLEAEERSREKAKAGGKRRSPTGPGGARRASSGLAGPPSTEDARLSPYLSPRACCLLNIMPCSRGLRPSYRSPGQPRAEVSYGTLQCRHGLGRISSVCCSRSPRLGCPSGPSSRVASQRPCRLSRARRRTCPRAARACGRPAGFSSGSRRRCRPDRATSRSSRMPRDST
mmetsp:Transcript_104934/g.282049  ORF Transcript_104934/g.282049 Transcript_104934/m.282049 type:complete len:194 (-) Transcript_104934:337-918(-)